MVGREAACDIVVSQSQISGRHAIIVNVIIAAFVTPTGDPFNLALMALPMMVCYELGVLGARIFGKKGETARFSG